MLSAVASHEDAVCAHPRQRFGAHSSPGDTDCTQLLLLPSGLAQQMSLMTSLQLGSLRPLWLQADILISCQWWCSCFVKFCSLKTSSQRVQCRNAASHRLLQQVCTGSIWLNSKFSKDSRACKMCLIALQPSQCHGSCRHLPQNSTCSEGNSNLQASFQLAGSGTAKATDLACPQPQNLGSPCQGSVPHSCLAWAVAVDPFLWLSCAPSRALTDQPLLNPTETAPQCGQS